MIIWKLLLFFLIYISVYFLYVALFLGRLLFLWFVVVLFARCIVTLLFLKFAASILRFTLLTHYTINLFFFYFCGKI